MVDGSFNRSASPDEFTKTSRFPFRARKVVALHSKAFHLVEIAASPLLKFLFCQNPCMPVESPSFSTLCLTRAGAKRQVVSQKENEDRVLARTFSPEEMYRNEGAVLVAVADGVSRCADGGGVADWILRQRVERDRIFSPGGESPVKQFHDYLRSLHRAFLNEFRHTPSMLESGCTFSAALIYGQQGAAYWSGDSPIYHIQCNGNRTSGRMLSIADKDPFSGALTDCFSGVTPFKVRQAGLRVKPGDIVITATDGVVFDVADLALSINQHGFNQRWLDLIIQTSYAVPYSDDISLSAVQICKG